MHTPLRIGSIAFLVGFITGCVGAHVPKEQKLVDCTNSTLHFEMHVQDFPPYQFVLGLPPGINPGSFRGELTISQSTGTVARVPVSSDALTPCNWLEGHSGYILTWARTNSGERLRTFLVRGQKYDVQVHFSPPPPLESSLWLSSIRKVGR